MLLVSLLFITSCSKDEPSSNSIFPEGDKKELSAFDQWLYDNFTEPYNIQFLYRYYDSETNNSYNVIPSNPEKALALALLIRHVWINAYEEVVGKDFIKQYGPKIYQLLGSFEYNTNGSRVLGYAESGIKITLFGVNLIDPDAVYINTEDPFRNPDDDPLDLNYWYFHTMHHEFFHILTQTKEYSTDFRAISAGHYHSGDWINLGIDESLQEGFISNYASGEYNEDIAEIYATYVTTTPEAWEKLMTKAAVVGEDNKLDRGQTGRMIIEQKLEMVKDYMLNTWGVDLEGLRTVVLRRSQEAPTLDLRSMDSNSEEEASDPTNEEEESSDPKNEEE